MSQDFSLDQKTTTTLVAVFLVLFFLVYVAGYLSGIIVGLPDPEPQPAVKAPVARPEMRPVPQPVVVVEAPEPEPPAPVEEPEPEPEPVPEIEPEPDPEELLPEAPLYSIQIGSFITQVRAQTHVQKWRSRGYDPYIYHGANSKGVLWYTVRISDFTDLDEAIAAARGFRTKAGGTVFLTEYNSLFLARTPSGHKIEVRPYGESLEDESPAVEDAVAEEPDEQLDEEDVTGDVVPEDESAADGDTETGLDSFQEELEAAETDHGIVFKIPEPQPEEDQAVSGLIAASEEKKFSVQIGAFLNHANAEKFAEKLRGRGYPAYVFEYLDSEGNAWNAVRTGDYPDPEAAWGAAVAFQENEGIAAIVTRIDGISMVYAK